MSETSLPQWILEKFPPDQKGLYALLASQMTPEMIVNLVNSDSVDGSELEREAMFRYVKELDYPREPDWHNLEILSLSRYDKPADREGHLVRAFSNTALYLGTEGRDEEGPIVSQSTSVIALLDSCYFLGEDYSNAFGRMLTWGIHQCSREDGFRPYIEFALLILFLRNGATLEQIVSLVELIDEDSSFVLTVSKFEPLSKEYSNSFLGFIGFIAGHDVWLGYAKVINGIYSEIPNLHDLTRRMLLDRDTTKPPKPQCNLGFKALRSNNLKN